MVDGGHFYKCQNMLLVQETVKWPIKKEKKSNKMDVKCNLNKMAAVAICTSARYLRTTNYICINDFFKKTLLS